VREGQPPHPSEERERGWLEQRMKGAEREQREIESGYSGELICG